MSIRRIIRQTKQNPKHSLFGWLRVWQPHLALHVSSAWMVLTIVERDLVELLDCVILLAGRPMVLSSLKTDEMFDNVHSKWAVIRQLQYV